MLVIIDNVELKKIIKDACNKEGKFSVKLGDRVLEGSVFDYA